MDIAIKNKKLETICCFIIDKASFVIGQKIRVKTYKKDYLEEWFIIDEIIHSLSEQEAIIDVSYAIFLIVSPIKK